MFTQLLSQELFIDQNKLTLGQITSSSTYCKKINLESSLCNSKKLSYIDYNDPNLPSFLTGLQQNIQTVIQAYEKNTIKTPVLENIQEFGAEFSGEWYNNHSITLFAKTPTTYTLSTISNGYTGGAHGYYTVHFDTYSIATQKPIKLDDLFIDDYNQTLMHIAEDHYKRTHELQPKQSLEDEGWFENKFVLAENIAITPQGLYFHYNSYEIQPYSAGQATFLLPYHTLYTIINPKGPLGFTLKNKDTFHTSFYDNETIFITLDTQINPDKTITLTATMSNLSFLEKGWFSLSFPQLQTTHSLVKKGYKGFETLKLYPKGSKVYHRKYKKAVSSHYLLVEAEVSHWEYKKENSITLLLKLPPQQKELIVDIHATVKSKNKTITIPDELEGIEGQQGYDNYRMFIGL